MVDTRMGSKVMPSAIFHLFCMQKDRIHTFYVFSYTCRHNTSREIHFCTNPTHTWLGKMVGRSVENANEIRADIKDIYIDIYTVMLVIQCHFLQFAGVYGNLVQIWGLLHALLNQVDLNLQVVQ